jgi:hypothetical protein
MLGVQFGVSESAANSLFHHKRQTLKNQVIVIPSGKEIVDVVVGETGATGNIKICRSRREE